MSGVGDWGLVVRLRILLGALFVACAPQAFGQTPAPLLPNLRTFVETVDANRPISGAAVAGVSVKSDGKPAKLQDLWVFIPSGFSGDIDVVIFTSDARYAGSVQFPVPSKTKGWVPLGYPSSTRQDILKSYAADPIAVHIIDRATGRSLLSRLGAKGLSEDVEVKINSERSQTFAVVTEGGAVLRKQCRRLSQSSSLRFDTICDIPRASLSADTPVRLLRRQGTSMLPQIEIDVRLD